MESEKPAGKKSLAIGRAPRFFTAYSGFPMPHGKKQKGAELLGVSRPTQTACRKPFPVEGGKVEGGGGFGGDHVGRDQGKVNSSKG